jgi:hypothetical protein
MSDETGNGDGIFGNRADEEIYEAFPQTPMAYGMDPADGLPRPAVQHAVQMAYAPPLSPETLVCMGDYSEFVARDEWGEILQRWTPAEIVRTPNGKWRVINNDTVRRFEVEPIRPPCKHYARQMIDFQDDPDAKFVTRLCTARRNSEEGFLSVRDSQVYACELRDPKHGASEEQLNAFDNEKVRLGRERTEQADEFDVEAALAAQQIEEPKP